MRLEKDLEETCVAKIERLGWQALKLAITGVRGFPDRSILMPGGRIFFVEFKREKTGQTSAQQRKWRRTLIELGFHFYLIDTEEDFDRALAAEIRLATPSTRTPHG